MRISDGDMLVDYKVRCEIDAEVDGLPCRMIRYGVSRDEMNASPYCPAWHSVSAGYVDHGGRLPGSPARVSRHYFNKRIMTDDESIAGQVKEISAKYGPRGVIVQGGGDDGGVGARDGGGGAGGAEEIASAEGCAGSGDSNTEVTT